MKGVKDEAVEQLILGGGAVHCTREGVSPGFLIDTGQESVEKWH